MNGQRYGYDTITNEYVYEVIENGVKTTERDTDALIAWGEYILNIDRIVTARIVAAEEKNKEK